MGCSRRISFLSFGGKTVLVQLMSLLNTWCFGSVPGYKALHRTETALLRILNDISLARDSGASLFLVLLDLTDAFDTVDHNNLLSRLED